MNANGEQETKTYRGRTLEEVLPRIKAELGSEAVITRQRDGLTGGVGGFFQRPCIEVEAQPSRRGFDAFDEAEPVLPEPDPLGGFVEEPMIERSAGGDDDTRTSGAASSARDAYLEGLRARASGGGHIEDPGRAGAGDLPAGRPDDAATREGLGSRAIQAMFEQAAPFADHLALAAEGHVEAAEALDTDAPEERGGGYAPPQRGGLEQRAARAESTGFEAAAATAATVPARPAAPLAAGPLLTALENAGIDSELAALLVGETVSHRLPFASPRSVKRLVREALAERIPVDTGTSGRGRSLAFVGPGGAGKTRCVARLCAAYAAGSDLPVVCLTLRPADGGAELRELLESLGVLVHAIVDGDQARAHVEAARGTALVVLDTPTVMPSSTEQVDGLAQELRAIGLDEVHLTLPSTFSGLAAQELRTRLEPLGVSRIAITHTDESSHVGGLIDMVISCGTPLSYVSRGTEVPGGLEPADPRGLASLVLP